MSARRSLTDAAVEHMAADKPGRETDTSGRMKTASR